MFDAMNLQGAASQAVAWLLTYSLHSTLFLGLAWLTARRLAQRMPAVEEAVWRFALIAGLVTASLQVAAGREPLGGSWHLAAAEARTVAAVPSPVPSVAPPPAAELRALETVPAVPRSASPSPSMPLSVVLPLSVTGLWLIGASLLAASWLSGYLRLRRRLRPRPQIVEANLVSQLAELRERAGLQRPVRLTCSSRLPVPIALGVRRAEICVPPRALAGLAPEQQEGMLAHELAHLVRRDPFWLAFGRLLASVLFFQPLNWIAVRRLRELSELLCDEWAVGRTGRPVSLARCLAEVAGWSFQPLGSLPAPGMADRPSNLARRIRRLLEDARSPQRRVHPLWLAAGMVLLVVTVAAAAPGVQAAVARHAAGQPAPAAVLAGAAAPGEAAPSPTPQPEPAPEAEIERHHEALQEKLAGDLEDEMERSLDGIDEAWKASMDLLAADIEADAAGGGLSEEEARAIEERYDALSDRISEQVEKDLGPRMEELGSRLEKQLAQVETSDEMRDLQRRAAEIAERARPTEEEMAKLHAEVDKLRAEGKMTEADKQKIREEARRVAEAHRMTAQERAEIDKLRQQAHELARRSMEEHRAEIEQMRQQIREEAREMREEIRRQLENDPQIRALRERRQREREERDRERSRRERNGREETPRPPRPEREVRLHIAPEVRVHVDPALAAVAPMAPVQVEVNVRPEIAPVALAQPTPRPSRRPVVAPVAPVAQPAPRAGRPAVAPVAQPAPHPGEPVMAPVAAPTPEPATPAVAPEPPGR